MKNETKLAIEIIKQYTEISNLFIEAGLLSVAELYNKRAKKMIEELSM